MSSYSQLGLAKQAFAYFQHFSSDQIQQLAVLDNETLTPIFVSANIMRMGVSEEKRATKFATETGATRSDHVVTNPGEIQIDFELATVDDKDQMEEMRDYFLTDRLVTVQTRLGTYPSMLIVMFPQEQSARIGASVSMRLQEWQEITAEYGEAMANPAQGGTKKRGNIQGQEVESKKGSILSRWGVV